MSKKKEIKLRVSEELYDNLKVNMFNQGISVNRVIVELLRQQIKNTPPKLLAEKPNQSTSQKIIEKRIRFTEDEAQILNKYAKENGWKITQEIRYRVIGSISKKGKISGEELQEIREIRKAINALGRNINRIIREDRVVDQEGSNVCKYLIGHIVTMNKKIEIIMQESEERFLVGRKSR